jgi:NADH-quinone oxidoreductase subunit E
VGHLSVEAMSQARQLISLYPKRRSALIPLCHLAQSQDGWLTAEAMEDIADLVGVTPAEVRGTASFYEMLRTEPVGRYVISVCTNIACLLSGAYELVAHAEEALGARCGGTTDDGLFTLEEAECVAACDEAPCLQVNYRFFGRLDPASFDALLEDLRGDRLAGEVPPHGVLCRVRREGGLSVTAEDVAAERQRAATAAQKGEGSGGGASKGDRG